TWRSQPSFLEPCTAAPIGAAAGWYEVGVTDIVSQWLSGSRNHGFVLKAEAQTLNNRRGFHSRQRYNAPLMAITYTVPPPDSATVSGLADADTYVLDREPDRGWGAEDLLLVGLEGSA
ncbi:MAG: DNRLRE domain-containing protein, partial [Acidimicrobiia bacterium]